MDIKGTLRRFSPFDGIGNDLSSAKTYEDAIILADLAYDVEKKKLFLENGTEIEKHVATIITGTDTVLGVVGVGYEVMNNKESFSVAEDVVNNDGATYYLGGVVRGPKNKSDYSKSFLIVKHNGFKIFDDEYESFTVFNNSFDESSAFTAQFINISKNGKSAFVRTFNDSRKNLSRVYIHHTKNAGKRMEDVYKILESHREYIKEIQKEAVLFSKTSMTKEEFERDIIPMVLSEMKLNLSASSDGKLSANVEKTIMRLVEAYDDSELKKYNGSLYKTMLTLSDFESHSEPFKDMQNPSVYFNRVLKGMPITNGVINKIIKAKGI